MMTDFSDVSFIRCGYYKTKKHLLENLSSRPQVFCNIIKTFDLSTLYTTIPHAQLQSRLKDLIQRSFSKRNVRKVTGSCFQRKVIFNQKPFNKYRQDEIFQMLDIFDRQHICPVWQTNVSTDNWYSNVYELCFTTR